VDLQVSTVAMLFGGHDRLSQIYLTKAWVGGRRKSWDDVKEQYSVWYYGGGIEIA
jgi:hypothetical protein